MRIYDSFIKIKKKILLFIFLIIRKYFNKKTSLFLFITSGYPACATMLKKEIHFVYYMWIDNF